MKKRILLSTVDQGLLSALNFLINLYLIKEFEVEVYGMYTLMFSIALLAVGLQNALINTPYSVRAAHGKSDAFKFELVNLLYCLISPFLISILFYIFTKNNDSAIATSSVFLYISGMLYKEYLRSKWVVDEKLEYAIGSDILYIVLIALSYIFIDGNDSVGVVDLNLLLLVFAVSSFLSVLIAIKNEIITILSSSFKTLFNYAFVWRQSRWSVVGVITTELQNRGYIFIVTVFFGLGMLGFIQAGRVFFGPLNLLISGWVRVVRPVLSKLYRDNEISKFNRILNGSCISFSFVNIVFSLFIFTFWGEINLYLYEGRYENIFIVVIQWALVSALTHIRSVYSIGLQSTNRFDLLSMATVIGSIAAFIVLAGIVIFDFSMFAVSSIILSEIVAAIVIVKHLRSQLLLSVGDKL